MIAIDLSKQQALGADPKVIQEISFSGNLDWDDEDTQMFFIVEDEKVMWDYCNFILF